MKRIRGHVAMIAIVVIIANSLADSNQSVISRARSFWPILLSSTQVRATCSIYRSIFCEKMSGGILNRSVGINPVVRPYEKHSHNSRLAAKSINFHSILDSEPVRVLSLQSGSNILLTDAPYVLLLGSASITPGDAAYTEGVVRNIHDGIIVISGPKNFIAEVTYNDGGIAYAPFSVLLLSDWPVNELGQIKPGSTITDKIVNLNSLDIEASVGSLDFAPAGYPDAGRLKLVTWPGGRWYSADIVPDGQGTYDLINVTAGARIEGGPQGFVYVPPGSSGFEDFTTVLVAEWAGHSVVAYQLDANGDPIPGDTHTFLDRYPESQCSDHRSADR